MYKNGQAGVSKATVSITFDNKDKKQTPLGYEQYDEITVTRQVQHIFFNTFTVAPKKVQRCSASNLRYVVCDRGVHNRISLQQIYHCN